MTFADTAIRMMRRVRFLAGFLCVAGALVCGGKAAQAQSVSRAQIELLGTLDTQPDQAPKSNTFTLDLGAGPVLVTRLEAEASKLYPVIPYVSLRYSDWFALDENEARFSIIHPDSGGGAGFRAGPTVKVDIGRPLFTSPDLRALPKIAPSLEVGAFASYTVGPARVRITARGDTTGGHGAIVESNARSGIFQSGRFGMAMEVEVDWVSRNYMRAFYGVSPNMTPSLVPRLTPFMPGAGFRNIDTTLMGQFQFTPHWSMIGVTQFSHLLGSAADSPLTARRGSTDKLNLGTFVVYSFSPVK